MPSPRPWNSAQPLRGTTFGRPRRPVVSWADLGLTADTLAWHDHAHCLDADPDAFFPEHGPDMRANIAAAKRICQDCPVRSDCLAYALANPDVVGIWGGLTDAERRREPRQGRRAKPRPHDREIVRLSRAGLSAEQIAVRLDISPRTVQRARTRHREREAA